MLIGSPPNRLSSRILKPAGKRHRPTLQHQLFPRRLKESTENPVAFACLVREAAGDHALPSQHVSATGSSRHLSPAEPGYIGNQRRPSCAGGFWTAAFSLNPPKRSCRFCASTDSVVGRMSMQLRYLKPHRWKSAGIPSSTCFWALRTRSKVPTGPVEPLDLGSLQW